MGSEILLIVLTMRRAAEESARNAGLFHVVRAAAISLILISIVTPDQTWSSNCTAF
jgi:hypothetical protein